MPPCCIVCSIWYEDFTFFGDNLLIEIFDHFKHSSKRCREFAVVEPVMAVKRLIELWPALHVYFDRKSEGWANQRVKRVAGSLKSIETKLYVHFIAFAVHPLNSHKDWHNAAVYC